METPISLYIRLQDAVYQIMLMLCKSETEKPCIKSADKTKDTAKVMGVDVGDDCENDGSGK